MVDLTNLLIIMFVCILLGFSIGWSLAWYQSGNILKKIEGNYKEIKKEFDL